MQRAHFGVDLGGVEDAVNAHREVEPQEDHARRNGVNGYGFWTEGLRGDPKDGTFHPRRLDPASSNADRAAWTVVGRARRPGMSWLNPGRMNGKAGGAGAVLMDPAALKADFGPRIVLNGGIDSHHVLIEGSPESIRRDTRQVLRTMMPGGGYIAGANHDWILPETPVANVLAMADAVREFGSYRSTLSG